MRGLVEWAFAILLKKRLPAPVVDATWGDPVARAIRTALNTHDFAGAEL